MTPVILRQAAHRDVTAAIQHYRLEAGADVANSFVDEFERVTRLMSEYPAVGSLRYSYELGIDELRSLGLAHFPYMVVWVPRHDKIDVWRVLHSRRDIPRTLQPGRT